MWGAELVDPIMGPNAQPNWLVLLCKDDWLILM
ncbi:hypothetical protein Rmet_6539 [Cupriavidus metallidurans CH34]|uniref:Uncharacterized protein n=1 Tax=Cupriavidus metallidurans (strain ATCC 43123 / DSM 2839 / NBRC 102507 / CH34) TaxID=266264 RepID=D3DXX6_CUPMC|nr:hypothetical protein Rmet_6539 [Cupriavidus metallidurans CH34]